MPSPITGIAPKLLLKPIKESPGLCGALYSATQILGADSPEAKALLEEFRSRLGATQCHSLKAELHIPCNDTVNLADELLEKYLSQQQERLQ